MSAVGSPVLFELKRDFHVCVKHPGSPGQRPDLQGHHQRGSPRQQPCGGPGGGAGEEVGRSAAGAPR